MTGPEAALRSSPAGWVADVSAALEDGFRFFDFLSVVDEADGGVSVVLHLWNRAAHESRFLRTVVPAGAALPSIAALLPGAAWAEREAHEMFGLALEGAADERPLLLPDGFAGHPLRKDFALASRGVEEWPGAHEPTEHGPAARPPGRRRPSAPGVPDWPAPVRSESDLAGGAG
jgi:NADH-quinone oxidoreductase subunit C